MRDRLTIFLVALWLILAPTLLPTLHLPHEHACEGEQGGEHDDGADCVICQAIAQTACPVEAVDLPLLVEPALPQLPPAATPHASSRDVHPWAARAPPHRSA